MEQMMQKNKDIIGLVGIFLTFFLIVSTIKAVREIRFVGSGVNPTNTISVMGKGEVEKAPDTAKVTFSVRAEKKVLADAQSEVTTKIDAIQKGLLAAGVEERYIKTDSYTSYPQYNYPAPCYGSGCPRSTTPTLRGYEVAHTITVSIKNLEKIEQVLGLLGQNGVSDMQGPQFGFEDDNAVSREARDQAIADAKNEAEKLAKSLGVKLVRIVSFSENSGSPMPMYARADMMGASTKEVTPVVPVGVQKVESAVTIVYEIR